MAESKTRWTIRVSKATDSDVRSYLAEHGGKRGDLSKFVERAAVREILRATVRDIRARSADIPARNCKLSSTKRALRCARSFGRIANGGRLSTSCPTASSESRLPSIRPDRLPFRYFG
jgi:hypothetical protein